jgi:hypothetical protein
MNDPTLDQFLTMSDKILRKTPKAIIKTTSARISSNIALSSGTDYTVMRQSKNVSINDVP